MPPVHEHVKGKGWSSSIVLWEQRPLDLFAAAGAGGGVPLGLKSKKLRSTSANMATAHTHHRKAEGLFTANLNWVPLPGPPLGDRVLVHGLRGEDAVRLNNRRGPIFGLAPPDWHIPDPALEKCLLEDQHAGMKVN